MCAAVATVAADAAKPNNMATVCLTARALFTSAGRETAFTPGARSRVMAGLRENRKTRQDCDVVFNVAGGPVIWAHRFVLAATYSGCDILYTTALTSDKTPQLQEWVPPICVIVTDLTSDMLELLVDFAYCAPLQEHVGLHNATRVLEVAEKYNIPKIRDHCIQMLERNLEADSCIGTYHLAVSKGYASLAAEAYLYLVQNFNQTWKNSTQFHSLTPDEMRTILADNRLHAPNEVDDVFRAILRWIAADVPERKKYMAQYLPFLRFVQCNVRDWEKVVTDPSVQADGDCLRVLNVIHQTLSRQSMPVGECAGVDLSARTWLTPRVPKDIAFLFGGLSKTGMKNSMHTFNCRTGRWRLLGNQPTTPRACHGMAVLNACIYVVGGSTSAPDSSVACFDASRNRWTEKASMVFARKDFCLAVLQGFIYAIGGRGDDNSEMDSVERYDAKSNRWCQGTPMNSARSCASAAVARGRIYVLGGIFGIRELDTVECYDPSSDAWTRVLTMFMARRYAQVVAYRDLIYVIGGYRSYSWLTSMEMLDLRRARSAELPSMAIPKGYFAAVLLEGYIYVIGGGIATDPGTPVERYDIKAGNWSRVEDVPTRCVAATACLVHRVENPELWI
ncbi:kelch-like protein 10 [Amblyomma americanum]